MYFGGSFIMLFSSTIFINMLKQCQAAFLLNFEDNRYGAKSWDTRFIKYRLSRSFPANETANIRTAIGMFERHTCIKFEQRRRLNGDGIVFWRTNRELCRGTVGKQPFNNVYGYWRCWSNHDLSLQVKNITIFQKIGYILHEIMHNFGFRHEHQRPDRDQYVKIFNHRIIDDHGKFFLRINDTSHDTFGTDYDPYSVMHYEPTLFVRPEYNVTLEPVQSWIEPDKIGQKDELSAGDIAALNKLFKCSEIR